MLSFHHRIIHVLLLILAINRQASGFVSPTPSLSSATTSQRYTYVQVPKYKLSTMLSTNQKNRKSIIQHSLQLSKPDDQEHDKIQYIRPYMKQLLLLCRPSNFPIVSLFHMLGVHISLKLFKKETISTSHLFLPLLKNSSMLMVLLSLLLVTSTSMITNDYYDARDGVDTTKSNGPGTENEHYHPLATGEVPFAITKKFDSYLYGILLLSSAFVPGIIPRLFVIGGSIITYLYTVHLKPKTWIKNLSCASLVAMSPVTSGLAAWQVLCDGTFLKSQGVSLASSLSFYLIFKSSLSFLVVSLFFGIFSREVLMDVTDYDGDSEAGIETVPVKHGKKFASRMALVCSLVSALSACTASLIPLIRTRHELSIKWSMSLLSNSITRKTLLAILGSGMMVQRAYSVWSTEGEDSKLAERAIRQSSLFTVLILASFV